MDAGRSRRRDRPAEAAERLPEPLEADELERVTAQPGAEVDERQLRDRALVAFLVSTGCRISEALQLDRADWSAERVIVRGKGDVESAPR